MDGERRKRNHGDFLRPRSRSPSDNSVAKRIIMGSLGSHSKDRNDHKHSSGHKHSKSKKSKKEANDKQAMIAGRHCGGGKL